MSETLLVTLIVLAAAGHLCCRWVVRPMRTRAADAAGCGSGCGSCGGCPAPRSSASREEPRA